MDRLNFLLRLPTRAGCRLRMLAAGMLLALLLTAGVGCASGGLTASDAITDGFASDIDAQYKDMTVSGRLTRATAGTLKLEVTAPSSLEGMIMEWDGEQVTASLYGLSVDVRPDSVPQSAFGKSLLDALDAAMRMQGQGERTEEGVLLRGELAAGAFELVSDPDTGVLRTLRIPSLPLTVTFSNVQQAEA